MGIHYDWDTKLYAEKGLLIVYSLSGIVSSVTFIPKFLKSKFPGDPLPVELVSFGSLISEVLGLGPFHPDAAIINFFPLKGTLGPHIDR